MAEEARRIVENNGVDLESLILMWNKALADEWFAFIQYQSAIGITKGLMRTDLEKELEEHAKEEYEHVGLIRKRIIELGGIPSDDPSTWSNLSNCGFKYPCNPIVTEVLSQNLEAERCAIKVYNAIMEATKGVDPISYKLARNILLEEIEHEQDLQDLQEDLEETLEFVKKCSSDL